MWRNVAQNGHPPRPLVLLVRALLVAPAGWLDAPLAGQGTALDASGSLRPISVGRPDAAVIGPATGGGVIAGVGTLASGVGAGGIVALVAVTGGVVARVDLCRCVGLIACSVSFILSSD